MTMYAELLIEIASGVPEMDKLHQDFFQALGELASKTDSAFSNEYGAFVAKVEQVFREEERWMEEIEYPSARIHREQHARALGALHNVHSRVMNGEIGLGREVVERLLPQWYSFHASTLDTTLALAMQLERTGPLPVKHSPKTGIKPLPVP